MENSPWYEERKMYIDLKSRGYMHFLLTGYESYIELFAKNDFKIEKISAYK